MQQLSILEAYAREAVKRAQFEQLDDSLVSATVPGLMGVIAFGPSHDETVLELFSVVEGWARLGMEMGHDIPVTGGVDLNTDDARHLKGY